MDDLLYELGAFAGVTIFIVCIIALVLFFYFIPVGLWITAGASGVRISLGNLIGMRLRKVAPSKIISQLIKLQKAGAPVKVTEMESFYLAGGDLEAVTNAYISVCTANLSETKVEFKDLIAIALAGRNVLEGVRNSVIPLVLKTAPISAVAKDGIELIVTAQITTRSIINKMVGNAGRETVLARVGEGIVTAIGQADDHKDVLANPERISNLVIANKLDEGTHYMILSIDIADIDVGENIGAKLSIDKAEADKKIAQANSERRRSEALALEQENMAKVQEMRARVVEAESKVPEAMASALSAGKIGIDNYYGIKKDEGFVNLLDTRNKTGLTINIPK